MCSRSKTERDKDFRLPQQDSGSLPSGRDACEAQRIEAECERVHDSSEDVGSISQRLDPT